METPGTVVSAGKSVSGDQSIRVGKFRTVYEICKQFGLAGSVYRFKYALLRKTGWLKRRFPADGWDAQRLANWCNDDVPTEPDAYRAFRQQSGARFFFRTGKLPAVPEVCHKDVIGKADAVLAGRLTYFSRLSADLGFPFEWFSNPFTGSRVNAGRHWCDRSDFESDQGDIKFIWEPSRFAWVYDLVRAYAVTGNDRYPRGFWTLVESWRRANPPNMGPNWQCGQECSLRTFALCFGLLAFWDAPATTAERVAMVAEMIATHAARIEANIEFALSQRNNHALSEAAALYTVGTLFTEFRKAVHWKRRGKALLEGEAPRQIYDDGSYIQHSMNYHRVMLHDYLWVLRLAELNGDRFSSELTDRLAKATDFLYQMQDGVSGRVPNYGANDGALVFPLTSCDYLDYRPVLQAAHYQLHRRRLYETGAWDEALLWLFGETGAKASVEPPPRRSTECHAGGYYTLRGSESWAMIRCHTFRERPGQCDMLHLDLWWRGRNILRDSGSYSYNSPPPWRHHFGSTSAHNTIRIDGRNQMIKGPRFMWFDWTRARFLEHRRDAENDTERWRGEHYGYQRACGVVHRREVRRSGETRWTIVDDLIGTGEHDVVLYWHLIDIDWCWESPGRELRLDLPEGSVWITVQWADGSSPEAEVIRGFEGPDLVSGWESLYYGERRPAPVLRVTRRGLLPLRIKTTIGLGQRLEGSCT